MKHRWQALVFLMTLSMATLSVAWPASAAEINGSARLYGGSLSNNGSDTEQLDQKYNFNLEQVITPFLTLRFGYNFAEFETQSDTVDFRREIQEPRFELSYRRPYFDSRIAFQERSTRGTVEDLDLSSLSGHLRWRPKRGPELSLQIRDESNVVDNGVFNRGTDSQILQFEALYERARNSIRYSYQDSELENAANFFSFKEERQQVRANTSARLLGDKLSLSADGWLSRQRQREEIGLADPAFPLPLREGLQAVDTTPEIGELLPEPTLVDGNNENGTGLEIGGAQTFRNLGADLGFSREASRIEILVNAPSAPDLFWEVYRSSDNESWTRVVGVQTEWDGALLRYRLRFPGVTDRYFKAVNVSVNTFDAVEVTELRVLVDVQSLSRREATSTTYRADLNAVYRPNERVRASFSLGFGNDETLAGGLLSRDLEELNWTSVVQVDLRHDLELRLGYVYTDVEELREPVLRRQEETVGVTLDYSPLQTLDAVLTASRREENDGGLLLRASDTLRLQARAELFPELEATTEITFSDVDDPLAGFSQSVFRWRETLVGRPYTGWTIWLSLAEAYYDSTGTSSLESRRMLELRSTWAASPFLTLSGDWSLSEDEDPRRPNDGQSLAQRYSVFWAPGPKLTASLTYQDTDSRDIRETTTFGASVNYRLNPRLMPYANYARSTFGETGGDELKNSSLRFGFNLFF